MFVSSACATVPSLWFMPAPLRRSAKSRGQPLSPFNASESVAPNSEATYMILYDLICPFIIEFGRRATPIGHDVKNTFQLSLNSIWSALLKCRTAPWGHSKQCCTKNAQRELWLFLMIWLSRQSAPGLQAPDRNLRKNTIKLAKHIRWSGAQSVSCQPKQSKS